MNGTDPSIGGPGADAGPDMLVFVSIAAGLGGSTRSLATVLSNLGPRATRVLAAPASGKFPDIVRELGLAEHTIPIPRPGDQRLRRASRPLAAYRIARWTWRHRRRVKRHKQPSLYPARVLFVAVRLSRRLPLPHRERAGSVLFGNREKKGAPSHQEAHAPRNQAGCCGLHWAYGRCASRTFAASSGRVWLTCVAY